MKYSWLILFVFSFSCSDFKEMHEGNYQNLSDLAIDNIETELPIINIIVDQVEFDSMLENFLEEIELDCRFYLYRDQETVLSDVASEVEVKGSRSATFELKSLGVKFDDSVDNSDRSIINPRSVLPFHNLDKIKSLKFRNSGNDFSYTFLKDAAYTQLAVEAELDLDLMYYEPCHVFVNGDYYALLNMRTESNAHGVSRLYNVKKDNITMVKIVPPDTLEFSGVNFQRIDHLLDYVEEGDVEELKENIDISNFIDYNVYETLLAHIDWPQGNARFYAIEEGKFRFVLYDLDFACSFEIDKAPIDFILNGDNGFLKDLFTVLYDDPSFKLKYDSRFNDLVKSGVFDSNHFEDILNNTIDLLDEDIIYHISKFGQPNTKIEWLRNVDEMGSFYTRRLAFVKANLSE